MKDKVKNKILPAVRVSDSDYKKIQHAALSEFRSLSNYILTCALTNASKLLK